MTDRVFMFLSFYASRGLYSLWTSIIKINLYNCLKIKTLESLRRICLRFCRGSSVVADTVKNLSQTQLCALSGHILSQCSLAFLLHTSWELLCFGPRLQLVSSWRIIYCLWKACRSGALISHDVLVVIQPDFLRKRSLRLWLSPLNCTAFYPRGKK